MRRSIARAAAFVLVLGAAAGGVGPGLTHAIATVSGTRLWVHRQNGVANGNDDAATGTQEWATRFNDVNNSLDFPNALAVSPDGSKVYVTGEGVARTTSPFSVDIVTIAYDTTTGSQLWLNHYDGPAHGGDVGRA